MVRYLYSYISDGIPDMLRRNSRRRFLTSLPTRLPFTSDQCRPLPTCASALVMASLLFRRRRMRSNRVLGSVKVRSRLDHVYLPMNQRVDYQLSNKILSDFLTQNHITKSSPYEQPCSVSLKLGNILAHRAVFTLISTAKVYGC